MKLPMKISHYWHQNELSEKNFPATAHSARNGAYRDFFEKSQKSLKTSET